MQAILHEIDFSGNGNWVSVEEPANFDSAEVDVAFTKDKARATLANLSMVWKGDTAKKIFAVYEGGKQGGKGVAHGLPYRITMCGTLKFQLMLVLGHSSTRLSCDQVDVVAWEAQGMDWFERECQAYSFWHLYKNLAPNAAGKINFSDFRKTPYDINTIPNYTMIVSLSFQELMLLWQLRELILAFTENSTEVPADAGEAGIPIVGTPHVIVTVVHIINLGLRIAEVIGYLILIGKFGKELQDNVIQRKKYKLCMTEKDLWLKICAFLGLQFSSPHYAPGGRWENATWMPEKIVMPKTSQNILDNVIDSLFDRPENEENNVTSTGYPSGTIAEWVERMEAKYNSQARIVNGVLEFKNINDWNVNGAYQFPNTGAPGYTFNLPNPFRTNLSQLAPYYEVKFQLDESDQNTIHRYRGTSAAIQILSPFPISKYSGWGTGQIIDLGSALAKRKEYLTKIESFLDNVLNILHSVVNLVIAPINALIATLNVAISAINALVSAWNAIAPSSLQLGSIGTINTIQNPIQLGIFASRIGWMDLSNDSFNNPKTFIGVQVGADWELDPNTEVIMSANNLLQQEHGGNLATRGNQYLLYDLNQSKFCCPEFFQILNKNILVTPDNKPGKFESIKWRLRHDIAREINYKVKETYLTGLSEKLIIDGTP